MKRDIAQRRSVTCFSVDPSCRADAMRFEGIVSCIIPPIVPPIIEEKGKHVMSQEHVSAARCVQVEA